MLFRSGATLLMFGTVAAAGIRIISSQEIGHKETLVVAVSLSLGLEMCIRDRFAGSLTELYFSEKMDAENESAERFAACFRCA